MKVGDIKARLFDGASMLVVAHNGAMPAVGFVQVSAAKFKEAMKDVDDSIKLAGFEYDENVNEILINPYNPI